ncbi:hypothetical protein COE25_13900 [Bacillus sp. AFS031507]|nr:hypothetical protein COE25_13900 [Bacillus sp. AFS031507]
MAFVDFGTMLFGAEGVRLLREDGAGEAPQALSAEEAPRTAPVPPPYRTRLERKSTCTLTNLKKRKFFSFEKPKKCAT